MTSTTLKIFIAFNQEGEFHISDEDADTAISELQGSYRCNAIRTIALNVTVELPVIETIPVTVPAQEQGAAEVTVS